MSARLLLDLRFAAAPDVFRGLYVLLYLRRAELPLALETMSAASVAGLVFGCTSEAADLHLHRLRALGLVGEGLELLAGVARARAVTVANSDAVAPAGGTDDLAARARASGRSVSDLARAAGIDRSALSDYLATGSGLGAERRARLAAVVRWTVGMQQDPCENEGVRAPVQ